MIAASRWECSVTWSTCQMYLSKNKIPHNTLKLWLFPRIIFTFLATVCCWLRLSAQSPSSPAELGIASQESLRLRWRNWLFLLGQHLLCVLKHLFKTTFLVCQDCTQSCPSMYLARFYAWHSIQTNEDYDCTHLSGIKIVKNTGPWTKLCRAHPTSLAVWWSNTSNYYLVSYCSGKCRLFFQRLHRAQLLLCEVPWAE